MKVKSITASSSSSSSSSSSNLVLKLEKWARKLNKLCTQSDVTIDKIINAQLHTLNVVLDEFFSGDSCSLQSAFECGDEMVKRLAKVEHRLLSSSAFMFKLLRCTHLSAPNSKQCVITKLDELRQTDSNATPLSPSVLACAVWKAFREAVLTLHYLVAQQTQENVDIDMVEPFDINKPETKESATKFRDAYVKKFTATHGDELDALRQDEKFDGASVSVLIDLMESGADTFEAIEKDLFLTSFVKEPNPQSRPTLHRSNASRILQAQAINTLPNQSMAIT